MLEKLFTKPWETITSLEDGEKALTDMVNDLKEYEVSKVLYPLIKAIKLSKIKKTYNHIRFQFELDFLQSENVINNNWGNWCSFLDKLYAGHKNGRTAYQTDLSRCEKLMDKMVQLDIDYLETLVKNNEMKNELNKLFKLGFTYGLIETGSITEFIMVSKNCIKEKELKKAEKKKQKELEKKENERKIRETLLAEAREQLLMEHKQQERKLKEKKANEQKENEIKKLEKKLEELKLKDNELAVIKRKNNELAAQLVKFEKKEEDYKKRIKKLQNRNGYLVKKLESNKIPLSRQASQEELIEE